MEKKHALALAAGVVAVLAAGAALAFRKTAVGATFVSAPVSGTADPRTGIAPGDTSFQLVAEAQQSSGGQTALAPIAYYSVTVEGGDANAGYDVTVTGANVLPGATGPLTIGQTLHVPAAELLKAS